MRRAIVALGVVYVGLEFTGGDESAEGTITAAKRYQGSRIDAGDVSHQRSAMPNPRNHVSPSLPVTKWKSCRRSASSTLSPIPTPKRPTWRLQRVAG